jgi:glyoxylase-like metal-dependent hydrolase (beta-lactamase superfamily II)
MRFASLLLTLWLPAAAAAQTGSGPNQATYTITKLAEGVYTLTWTIPPGSFAIGNATFIVGDEDAIVVDTGLSREAGDAILGGLRQVTDKPVSMVINTHWHGDHIFGNQVFKKAFPAARFIAHAATREGIITGEIEYRDANRPKTQARLEELKARPSRTQAEDRELRVAEMRIDMWQGDYVLPDMLVGGKLTIMQGKRRIDLLHLGSGNTAGDLIIHLPAERIAINGDQAITPVPFAYFCAPRAWIATLDRLAALDAGTFVPGHGRVQTSAQFIRDLQAMLRSLVEQVDEGVKAGLDAEAIKARVKVTPAAGSVYEKVPAAVLDANFRVPGIESALRELKVTG